jgi:hypothetical protein
MNARSMPFRQVDPMPWLWAGLLLAGLALLAMVAGYDGLYGQDAYAHLNYARDIQEYMRNGRGCIPSWARFGFGAIPVAGCNSCRWPGLH